MTPSTAKCYSPAIIKLCSLIAVVAIVANGCAWRTEVQRLGSDLHQIVESVSRLASRPPGASIERVDGLEAKLGALGAQLRVVETHLQSTTAQVARLESRVAVVEFAVQNANARLDGVVTTIARLEAIASRPPAPAVATLPSTPVVIVPRETPDQAYASALAMFRGHEHGQAVLDFLDFLARYPGHPLASSAQYWIGEAYFLQRDYRQALFEFDRVLAYGPRAPKAPDALLRAGAAASQLRDTGRAEQYWRRIVEEYPSSDAAQKARGFTSGIGGSPPSR